MRGNIRIVFYSGYIMGILTIPSLVGCIGFTSGIYWENGKENGNYHIIGFRVLRVQEPND